MNGNGLAAQAVRTTELAPGPDARLLQLVLEHGAAATFVLDLASELCLYVSPAVRHLLGREPHELTRRRLPEFVHPDERHEVSAASLRHLEGGAGRAITSRMLHADGDWVWVQLTASPALNHAGLSVAVVTASNADDRARAEAGLHSTRTHLRHLLEVLGEHGDLPNGRNYFFDLTVETLAAALELRDDETCQHARRVTELALELTAAIDPGLVANPELRYAYLLHDIGKIGIPDAILLKPGRLSGHEQRTLEMHTTLGDHLLTCIPFVSQLVHDVVAHHHERWDGNGYPWGLRGEGIPIAARIFAVADAFDALTNDRPYRKAVSDQLAVAEIERSAGSHFDPAVVEAFVSIVRVLPAG